MNPILKKSQDILPWQDLPRRFSGLLVFLIPLVVFITILADRSTLFRPLSLNLRTGFTLVAPALLLVFYASFRLPGRWGWVLSLAASGAAFALSLAGIWASGQSQSTSLSGLIPLTDANQYYSDAQRLLAGLGFEQFSAWRPLFPGLLALILGVTGGDLVVTLGVLVGIAALSCSLLAVEIRRTHGPAAAALALLVLFLYYRQRIGGMTLSENLGLALGTLSLCLLWRGAAAIDRSHRLPGLILLGLLGLSLALNARPGAFFVLPLVLLWAGWHAREGKPFGWRFFLLGVGAVLLGFALNLLVLLAVSREPALPFSNLSYALYGLAAGGKGWNWIQVARPDVMSIAGLQRHLVIVELAWELVRQNPANLAAGFLHEYGLFFSNTYSSLYGFASSETAWVTLAARLGLFGLCALGLARCLVNARRKQENSRPVLALAGALGMLLSVAFVPPGDAYGMRLYAATMPLAALLPALGLDWIAAWLRRWPLPGALERAFKSEDMRQIPAAAPVLLLFLIGASVLGPLFIRATARPRPIPSIACPAGQVAAVVDFMPGTWIRVIREDVLQLDWLPEFHAGRFRWNIHGLPDSDLVDELDQVPVPAVLFTAVDLVSSRSLLLIVEGDLLPEPPARAALCGEMSQTPAGSRYGIFYARELIAKSVP